MIGTIIAKKSVRAAFDAMNRHDLETFMATWDANGVFVYPGDIYASGRFEGKSAVEGWFQGFFSQFPSIRFEIHDLCA
jgi:ketosteroid isomerase-like protein